MRLRPLSRSIAALLLLGAATTAQAFDPFRISDIRIEGLERISAGTVLTYLPLERGDTVNSRIAADALRALYETGFFSDVELSRDGDILVIAVAERPAISKIEVSGNKGIKTEELMKGLRGIGLTEGETFDRLALDRVTQELTRQYYNRGKYNVRITPTVRQLDRNRVEITIVIGEGPTSKIRHINIVGNKRFTDEEIIEAFESKTTNWLSWYSRDDQYSREKLSGDLEKLRAFYLDRGYVDFDVESTGVSISQDRNTIYISASVREGELYTFGETKLTGDFVVGEDVLRQLVIPVPGTTFSRQQLDGSAELMQKLLANYGYAFAKVTPIPDVDREKRVVGVTFFVDPGKRVYVRRINFVGNARTHDEVLRREMRQFEGGWFSQALVDRSKIRLQRTGFFKEVEIETPKVSGSEDQVDVIVKVEERQAGQFQFALGYSGFYGVQVNLALTQENFLGRGNRVGFAISNSTFQKRFDLSYFNPYWTDDGISRGYNLRYASSDFGETNLAGYSSDRIEVSTVYSFPVSETDRVNFQIGVDRNRIGNNRTCVFESTDPNVPPSCFFNLPQNYLEFLEGTDGKFDSIRAQIGYARDTRNRFPFPNAGAFQRVGAEITLPGSDLQYYKLFGQYQQFTPLIGPLVLMTNLELGYGDAYAGDFKDRGLPFFENFYSGGVRSVRGYRDNTLGPRTEYAGQLLPIGGAVNVLGNVELLFPTPFAKDTFGVRLAAFVDVGNVYKDWDAFDTGELRYSAGLSLQWQAPIGPIVINLARPLNKKDGDETESIQFSFGGQ